MTGASGTPVMYLQVTISPSDRSGSIYILSFFEAKIAALGLSADLSYIRACPVLSRLPNLPFLVHFHIS